MLYIKEGHKKDMWFVCVDSHDNNDRGGYSIVKVFYSEHKAEEYIKENGKIGDR